MKLGDGPALLVLSGQGTGNGVEHFPVPVSAGAEYPPMDLLEKWCALSDPFIPTLPQDLVLMIARQATHDGTPWAILSLYVKANLKRTRKKQYAGIGLVAKEAMIPTEAIPVIQEILEAMIDDRMVERRFADSLSNWSPPDRLLRDLSDLTVESLLTGFEGIQPGQEKARIFHGVYPDDIVKDAQESRDFDDFCAVFLLNRDGPPAKGHEYVISEFDVTAWEDAQFRSPSPAAHSLRKVPPPANGSNVDGDLDYGEPLPRQDRNYESSSPTRIASDLKLLEETVDGLHKSMSALERRVCKQEERRAKLGLLDWAFLIAAGLVSTLAVGLFWKYVASDRPVTLTLAAPIGNDDLPKLNGGGTKPDEAAGGEGLANGTGIPNAAPDAPLARAPGDPNAVTNDGSQIQGPSVEARIPPNPPEADEKDLNK